MKDQIQSKILMYHGIISDKNNATQGREAGAELYDVTASNFWMQMKCLEQRRYQVKTLEETRDLSSNKVIVTFDDGEMNNYTQALPVLLKLNFSGYFFIIAQKIGKPGYMGWKELRELCEAGMVVGSHGFSHEILTNLLDTQIDEELRASKRYLEKNLDMEVTSLSIPRGFYNPKIIQAAYDIGYKHIFISERMKECQEQCFSRIAVKGKWSIERFEQALDGQVPRMEKIGVEFKEAFKRIFGGQIYGWIRRVLLKVK